MASHLYIFRIIIASKERLLINIEAPNGSRELSANFGYDDTLLQAIAAFQQKARQANANLSSSDIRQLGEKLFLAVFDKTLQTTFEELYEEVKNSDSLLRVELDIDEEYLPQVAAFPWEFMRPKEGTAVLPSTSPNLILSRRPRFNNYAPRLELDADEKIRVLLVASYPGSRQDAKLGPVLYEPVKAALETLANAPNSQIELIFSDDAQRQTMADLLKEHKPHIFHFIGHGRLHQPDGGQERGELALAPKEGIFGDPQWLDAFEFSNLLQENYLPSLVLLQACEGARLSESHAFASVASRVIRQNIPAVVGMQYIVSNAAAVQFANTFYQKLAADAPIDVAVQKGRHALIHQDEGHAMRDFATPVLFMRLKDGRLIHRRRTKPKQVGQLRQALIDLNFNSQRDQFFQIRLKSKKTGAFLLTGAEKAGHNWLRNLLLKYDFKEELDDAKNLDPIYIDIADDSIVQTIDTLWEQFALQLDVPTAFGANVDKNAVIAALKERRKNNHLIITLDNICKPKPDYPQSVVRHFWQPLTNALQQNDEASDSAMNTHWLLLFMIDTSGTMPDADQDDGPVPPDPAIPIFLPRLSSHFSESDLNAWWRSWRTRSLMEPVVAQYDTIESLEKLRQYIWQKSGNGEVLPLLNLVCQACRVEWKELEGL